MNKLYQIATAGALLGLAACTADSRGTTVARAHTFEFTADDAVQLIGPQVELPNDPGVVQTVADLWIDYTLLAWAVQEDTLLAHLDMGPLVQQQVDQDLILELYDQVIQPDTAVTEEDLRELFARDAPGVQARASHILLGFPEQATEAQRDSIRAELEAIRARIARGENFGALARTYSQDRGSGQQGGDMGYFDRGQMVRPFDEAVFALDIGEVSEVVETPFGFHLIRLDDLISPTFEEARVEYRTRLQNDRTLAAESLYIADLFDRGGGEVAEGAADIIREVARNPRTSLSRRALGRVLVSYDGGAVDVADLQDFMETRDANFRVQVLNASDEVLESQILDAILQKEFLLRAAAEAGLSTPEAQRDSLAALARGNFRGAAGSLGLLDAMRGSELSKEETVTAAVDELMDGVVSGRMNVLPLGPIALTLRKHYRSELFEAGIIATVTRLAQIRGPAAPAPAAAPPIPSDTLGN